MKLKFRARSVLITAFVLAYPVFLFNGVVASLLGGQFAVRGLYSAGLALALVGGACMATRLRAINWMDVLYMAFMAWVFFQVAVAYGLGHRSLGALTPYLVLLLWYGGTYSLGRFVDFQNDSRFLVGLLTTCVVLLLPLVDWTYLYIPYEVGADGAATVGYQGFGRSIFVILLLALFTLSTSWKMVMVAVVGAAALGIVGSRSEFYAFSVGCAVAIALLVFTNRRALFVIASAGIVAITVGLAYWIMSGQSLGNTTLRIMELFSGESTSLSERMALFFPILLPVVQNDLSFAFGDILFYADITGSTGLYLHNILSVLTDFGLVGLILYVSLCLFAAIELILATNGYRKLAAIGLAIACIVMVLGAKSLFWAEIALFWGLGARCRAVRCKPLIGT
ncbi:hypothetical protein [Achromobacter xylosoxidans]|uniref:hypothetical protein n=3 Tax=Alcaligenes xylosoxydans xylosoxydans TaxID=85698 RepID=UPI0006C65771|nr:hypothetical protein [Achromobacter xylosoxidans]CUK08490.1 Uncharacterised protein [Achromobacter xylosoxidans]